jgi:hypothetical protein
VFGLLGIPSKNHIANRQGERSEKLAVEPNYAIRKETTLRSSGFLCTGHIGKNGSKL